MLLIIGCMVLFFGIAILSVLKEIFVMQANQKIVSEKLGKQIHEMRIKQSEDYEELLRILVNLLKCSYEVLKGCEDENSNEAK